MLAFLAGVLDASPIVTTTDTVSARDMSVLIVVLQHAISAYAPEALKGQVVVLLEKPSEAPWKRKQQLNSVVDTGTTASDFEIAHDNRLLSRVETSAPVVRAGQFLFMHREEHDRLKAGGSPVSDVAANANELRELAKRIRSEDPTLSYVAATLPGYSEAGTHAVVTVGMNSSLSITGTAYYVESADGKHWKVSRQRELYSFCPIY